MEKNRANNVKIVLAEHLASNKTDNVNSSSNKQVKSKPYSVLHLSTIKVAHITKSL
ncbi:hypothetical protein ES703_105078 [subsurface metagenome]